MERSTPFKTPVFDSIASGVRRIAVMTPHEVEARTAVMKNATRNGEADMGISG
jgi:hypothetical protein